MGTDVAVDPFPVASGVAFVGASRLAHEHSVDEAARVFALLHARTRLRMRELDDYHRFAPATRKEVVNALAALAGL